VTELSVLQADIDEAEAVRSLLPSTMAVIARFVGDPERRSSIPVSSCSQEQGAVWQEEPACQCKAINPALSAGSVTGTDTQFSKMISPS
jgi:hypothetical protein